MLSARLRDRRFVLAMLTMWPVFYAAHTQTALAALPTEGEVVAEDVYVRSGPSLNHYTTTKLSAGDRVRIVDEKDDWFAIAAPANTFSLISGDYVDTVDNKRGVVNGNNVRVRAGSQLNSSKYTVQLQLSKGDEVTILGRNPDGFLRITPPKGAYFWISKKFIEPITADRAAVTSAKDSATVHRADADGQTSPLTGDRDATGNKDETSVDDAVSPFGYMEPTQQRRALEALEAPLKVELEKPLLRRNFDTLVKQYQTIVSQDEDLFSKQYAEGRVRQIEEMISLANTVRNLRNMNEQTDEKRRRFLVERGSIHAVEPPTPLGLDAKGELRESALYPATLRPRRLRLVDTSGATSRTIGYVEIPTRSEINVNDYIGRYVGVRASTKRLQAGSVNPVPIYVASELVMLQSSSPADSE